MIWLAGAACLAALIIGHGVHDRLALGESTPIGATSTQANLLLRDGFGAGTPDVGLIAGSALQVDDPRIAAAGAQLVSRIAGERGVERVVSYWQTRSTALRSRDGWEAMIFAYLGGDHKERTATSRRLVADLGGQYGPLAVMATGQAQVRAEGQERSEADLRKAELIAAPLTLGILLLVFGSLIAALLPVLVGAMSVVATMAVLRLLTEFTEISVFAMSVASLLGFALAVDFSLFIVSRFREELAVDGDAGRSIAVTMRTTAERWPSPPPPSRCAWPPCCCSPSRCCVRWPWAG